MTIWRIISRGPSTATQAGLRLYQLGDSIRGRQRKGGRPDARKARFPRSRARGPPAARHRRTRCRSGRGHHDRLLAHGRFHQLGNGGAGLDCSDSIAEHRLCADLGVGCHAHVRICCADRIRSPRQPNRTENMALGIAQMPPSDSDVVRRDYVVRGHGDDHFRAMASDATIFVRDRAFDRVVCGERRGQRFDGQRFDRRRLDVSPPSGSSPPCRGCFGATVCVILAWSIGGDVRQADMRQQIRDAVVLEVGLGITRQQRHSWSRLP